MSNYRTPTRLLSPEQKRVKRLRWKANRRARGDGRPKSDFGILPMSSAQNKLLVAELENMSSWQVEIGKMIMEGRPDPEGILRESFAHLHTTGEEMRRQKQHQRKRTYHSPP